MRVARVTIELENGECLIAEGPAIQEFDFHRQYEIERDPNAEFPQMRHSGFRSVHIALKATCRYFVSGGAPPPGRIENGGGQ